MKTCDFLQLSVIQQAAIIYDSGTYIGKLTEGGKIRVLYQVDDFYVQVTYQVYRIFIEEITCFTGTSELEPYLSSINIAELINF